MALFFKLDAFSDNTWASIQLMSWTLAEPGVVFICACLPALWPLLALFMPRISTLHNKSGKNTSQYGHIESDQHGVNGLVYSNDDSVPLNAVESIVVAKKLDSAHDTCDVRLNGVGINVTKDFSWEEVQSRNISP